jgi:hypothetical protein
MLKPTGLNMEHHVKAFGLVDLPHPPFADPNPSGSKPTLDP